MANNPKKILSVEDNKLLQQVYFDKLVKEGFIILQAYSGPQGLTMATNYLPDLIILDIMLPGGLNGFDVLSQLRANVTFKHTPIVMLTDLTGEKKTSEAMGATDYIIKDEEHIDEIMSKIKSYLQVDFVGKIKKILE